MGLTVREMLASTPFSEYRLLAGGNGLDNQIQGVAILDAPDGYTWTSGREFVISSGYLFHQHPDLLEEMVHSDQFKMMSGVGIKDRFIKKIPGEILQAFDRQNIPLILIPPDAAWMDIMNHLNVMVMNKNIRQFKIGRINPANYTDLTYQSRKIERILSQIEKEMGFPGMLYDVTTDKAYYSSGEFLKLADQLDIHDFWNPAFPVMKEVLCDNLTMIRYRYMDERYEIPYSWITVPITVMGKIRAYFVLVEATGLIDFFDQFAIRIGFLLLQSLFEQFLFLESIGDFGFEKFVNDILHDTLASHDRISHRAADINIDVSNKFYVVLMNQFNPEVTASAFKDEINRAFNSAFPFEGIRVCFVSENSVLLMVPKDETDLDNLQPASIERNSLQIRDRLTSAIIGSTFVVGIADTPALVFDLKKSYEQAQQTIKIGSLVFPEKGCITYSQLGVLAWIHTEESELRKMMEDMENLLCLNDSDELIQTLKMYLRCRMNYSLTAKNMFIHINTVRKRIEQINEMLGIDLDDPISRLKLELFLMLT
ncbi:MAG: PucR family transcriptional regulator ligand-binding domain-containing protein [Bacillota bacterium]|nr:PucR family transcriptional regulator ligand-binding domain-containing protein [Bacillota bacterium]MDW7678481.1 PucR family transcriptional regulator ligand-binding domain-containing protein [Bacillota bacterium]